MSLGNGFQLVANLALQLAHLVADSINYHEVIGPVAGRPACFESRKLRVLRAQLGNHIVFEGIGDRRINRGLGRVALEQRLQAIEAVAGLRSRGHHLTSALNAFSLG